MKSIGNYAIVQKGKVVDVVFWDGQTCISDKYSQLPVNSLPYTLIIEPNPDPVCNVMVSTYQILDDQVIERLVPQVDSTLVAKQLVARVKSERDALLVKTDGIVERHRDQKELGGITSLTDDQYKRVLIYRQQLRDVPSTDGFPNVSLPTPPDFLIMV